MNTIHRYFLPLILPLLGAASFCHAQSFSLLHSFTPSEGRIPNGDLILSGTTLYGTARAGGAYSSGSVYALSADGSTFQRLHSFTGAGGGIEPLGGVVLSGGSLFGTTIRGGSDNCGTIFSLDSDGTDFQILRSFHETDGALPFATLTLSGTTLYGTTNVGGNNSKGTVFSIGTDGSGYQVRHAFARNGSQGANPASALTLAGSTLYGTTTAGGANGRGTIFSLDVNGSGFTTIFDFVGSGTFSPNDLTVSGTTIYGTSYGGGPTNQGYVFSLDITGSNFQMLHFFSGSDGAYPQGLTLVGPTLFGTTAGGLGGTANGTIFSISTDGTDFTTLRSYGGIQTTGAGPSGDLLLSGNILYGVTSFGGSASEGTVFTRTIPEPASASLVLLGAALCFRRRSLRCFLFKPPHALHT